MTMHITKNQKIGGVPARDVRDILKRLYRNQETETEIVVRAGYMVCLTLRRAWPSMKRESGSRPMASCPKCNHGVHIPLFMHLSGLSWQVACPHCKASLKWTKSYTSVLVLIAVLIFIPAISFLPKMVGLGVLFPAFVGISILVTLLESLHPNLQLCKKS